MYIQNNPQSRIIQITNVPDTLFDEPIQFITIIKKIREKNDPTVFLFTLYTKDYKINLTKTAYIYNDTSKNETIETKNDHVDLNLYNTEFLKLTVKEIEDDDILHKRIYLTLHNTQYSCDECLEKINECRQYNNNQNEYYDQMRKNLGRSQRDISRCNEDNAELKQMIDSKIQENKNCKDSQSTQTTTIIIICVAIIILLLGLCIYLYFFKQ